MKNTLQKILNGDKKVLVILLAPAFLSVGGCNKYLECKKYLVWQGYGKMGQVYKSINEFNLVPPMSPTRMDNKRQMLNHYRIVSEDELRELGFNPENEAEYIENPKPLIKQIFGKR